MQEILQKLPKKTNTLLGDMYNYQGFWYEATYLHLIISAQQNFKANQTDIVLSSYPKTGTTWTKALAFAIATRKKFDDSSNPLLTSLPHDCIPCLEIELSNNQNRKFSDLPFVNTHIPYSSLPESIIASDCKIVYICRDAKDVVVSQYEFLRRGFLKIPKDDMTFHMAYEEFSEGSSLCGPYWDHILGYWKASLERPDKILFLKYEDLKSDACSNVKKLAQFMGYPFSAEEEKEGAVEHIVKLCSFERLSNLEVNKTGTFQLPGGSAVDNQLYFRKGEVGDWKNYLTVEMKEKLEQIMKQKLPF